VNFSTPAQDAACAFRGQSPEDRRLTGTYRAWTELAAHEHSRLLALADARLEHTVLTGMVRLLGVQQRRIGEKSLV